MPTTPTAVRSYSRSGKATIMVTLADGQQVKVGGARAERAQAIILATWSAERAEAPGFYGARADVHAAQTEAYRLANATTVRAGRLHLATTRTPATAAEVVIVTDQPSNTTPQQETTMPTTDTPTLLIANGKAHKATCKRLPAGAEPYTLGTPAQPASCCKPKLIGLADLVGAKAADVVAELVQQPPTPEPEAEPEPTTDVLPEGLARIEAAKAEHKAHKAWVQAGKVGPEPTTPNLDAVNAVYAEQGPKAARPKAPKADGTRATRTAITNQAGADLYAQAMAAKKAKARTGSGAKATDAELVALAEGYKAQGLASRQAMEVAYWLGGLAFSRTRWDSVAGPVWGVDG